jgi:hypothetical protein
MTWLFARGIKVRILDTTLDTPHFILIATAAYAGFSPRGNPTVDGKTADYARQTNGEKFEVSGNRSNRTCNVYSRQVN